MSERPWLLIPAAMVAVALIGLLFLVLLELRSSHDSINQQKQLAQALLDRSAPVLRTARPLLNDVEAAIPPLQRSRHSLSVSLREIPGISASVEHLAGDGGYLLAQLQGLNLGVLTGGIQDLTSLASNGTLSRVLADSETVLTAVSRTDLVQRAGEAIDDLQTLVALQRRALTVQIHSYRKQSRSLRVQTRSLAIQKKSLRHIRAIDARTGGTVLPPSTP
jgi:hypothetical protein